MNLLARCRSCLQCLPIFQISGPASPPPPIASAEASSISPQEGASEAYASPDPTQSSADTALLIDAAQKQDLPPEEESNLHSSLLLPENEDTPASQIIIAPPVSSSPPSSSTPDNFDTNKPIPPFELPLRVPFINDISFPTSGLMPLPSPITPAPFGAGYNAYPAGQYHPPPNVYNPPGSDASHDNGGHSHQGHGNSHFEHPHSHDGHGHSDHGLGHPHHEHEFPHDGHDDTHHSHSSSHDGHDHTHETHAHVASSMLHTPSADISAVDGFHLHDATTSLETSESTPECLDVEAKHDDGNGVVDSSANMSGESALIETYHSEPIVVSGVPDEDDTYTTEGVLDHNASSQGRRRRRRDNFKEQFKGIRQQIKEGGHHFKEEGSKHLNTIMSNVNKQAQQIEQSGSFFMVPRSNKN